MSLLRSFPAWALLTLWPAAMAQVVVIDNFQAGNFNDTGSGNGFIVAQLGLPHEDVIGGTRWRLMQSISLGYHLDVASDRMNLQTDAGLSMLALAWGRLVSSDNIPGEFPGSHLGVDITANGNHSFQLQVPEFDGTRLVARVHIQSPLLRESSSPTFEITGPGTYTIPYSSLSGNANFQNVSGIYLNFRELTVPLFSTATLELSSFSMVPEPEEWAAAAGASLLAFGLWRRRRPQVEKVGAPRD